MDVRQYLSTLYETIVQNVVVWTPRVILGLVLVVVAIVVSRIIARMLRTLLKRLGVDGVLERFGVTATLTRVGVNVPLSSLIPRVVYYLVMVLFVRTAADAMGLFAISSAIGSFLAYLPNVFAAVVIILLGSAVSQVASGVVTRGAENSGIEFARPLGAAVGALILTIVGLMAIAQLKVDTQIVYLVVTGVLACIVLALGLSFGLGSRDITRNILAGFYARRAIPPGSIVSVSGEQGTLIGIGPTQTLLQGEQGTISLPNSVFLDDVARLRSPGSAA